MNAIEQLHGMNITINDNRAYFLKISRCFIIHKKWRVGKIDPVEFD